MKNVKLISIGLLLSVFLISGNLWSEQEIPPDKGLNYHPIEFSTFYVDDLTARDRNANPAGGVQDADPGQVIFTSSGDIPGPPKPKDSDFDYDPANETGTAGLQLDALANSGDAYFWMVKHNTAKLLVSFKGDEGETWAVWYETPAGVHGKMWSHNDLSNLPPTKAADPNFEDLDALETYGPGDNDDADNASYEGDPGDYSIYRITNPTVGWFPKSDIISAITNLGWTGVEGNVDVDALMVSGAEIIFSIRAEGNWDGGELVVMTLGNPAGATFLNHGGHLWNTAFDIQTAFGVSTEEVDAIEAWGGPVPPPSGGIGKVPSLTTWGLFVLLLLLIISGAYVIYQRKKGIMHA